LQVYFAGALVDRLQFMVNPCNLSVMICIISYGGSVSVGVCVDGQVVKDVDLYMACIEEELEDIVRAGDF